MSASCESPIPLAAFTTTAGDAPALAFIGEPRVVTDPDAASKLGMATLGIRAFVYEFDPDSVTIDGDVEDHGDHVRIVVRLWPKPDPSKN